MISQSHYVRNCREISFNAIVPGHSEPLKTTFRDGWGPCGRWVMTLRLDFTATMLVIRQESYEHAVNVTYLDSKELVPGGCETKTFMYKLADIVGRITAVEA
ncbi:hypothetical protein PF70_03081 [Pseudomonas asplenii]|nr:hypothetical protein PF70_03081 [Pseudomonas fuscovaginae]